MLNKIFMVHETRMAIQIQTATQNPIVKVATSNSQATSSSHIKKNFRKKDKLDIKHNKMKINYGNSIINFE